jgi:DNA-directed RNA polymerase specialized sigma subunit
MNEYVIHAKLKNNLILSRILERYPNVGQFCKDNNLSPSEVGYLINLKERALLKTGQWSHTAKKLAEALQCAPEDLFTDELKDIELKTNQVFIEINRQQLLTHVNPLHVLEQKEVAHKLLEVLTDRERKIINARYLEDEKTYEQIGKEFDVSTERIRQIERRAFKKMLGESKKLDFLWQDLHE